MEVDRIRPSVQRQFDFCLGETIPILVSRTDNQSRNRRVRQSVSGSRSRSGGIRGGGGGLQSEQQNKGILTKGVPQLELFFNGDSVI